MTRAQAVAVAKAGHLTGADLPGYTVRPGTAEQSNANDAQLAACLGVKLPSYVFQDPGVELHRGDVLQVDSSIDTVTSASDAHSSVVAFLGPKAPRCFEQQFRAILQREGATSSSLHVAHVPVRVAGADISFGMQLSGTFVVQGTQARISAYQLGAGIGQAEVSVVQFDAGPSLTRGAPSEAQLAALLQKSVNRVRLAYPR